MGQGHNSFGQNLHIIVLVLLLLNLNRWLHTEKMDPHRNTDSPEKSSYFSVLCTDSKYLHCFEPIKTLTKINYVFISAYQSKKETNSAT